MNENKAIYIFLAIAIVMFLTVGATYAYWQWTTNSAQQTAISFTATSGISCSANGGGNITSSDVKLAPTSCTDPEYAIQRTITTSVTNNNQGSVYLSLNLKVNSMASELAASENFKYALTTSPSSCTTGVIKTGTFTGATTNSTFTILEDQEYQTSPGTGTYYLYIWLDEAETNNNTQNKAFNLSLTGVCTNYVSTIGDTLSQNAVIDNTTSEFVTNSTGIDFNAISSNTNGKGLYIRAGTENDAHPIYYYRGAVDNNNVLFAGFCWKIVRTTSTGGTKLIYNGLPSGKNNNTCTNTTGTATQLSALSKFNDYSLLNYVGYMYGIRYELSQKSSSGLNANYLYGNSFIYQNGTYTLSNIKTSSGTWSRDYNTLNSNHYTCFNKTGTCTSLYYIYYTTTSTARYITLTDGKSISDALDEMFNNITDSTIKMAIDTWYYDNMASYADKLEDTPWCNDRSIYQLNGLDPNGGDTTQFSYFDAYGRMQSSYTPALSCNLNDAFTLPGNSHGNGKLTYPVGLLTADEIRLAGGKNGSGNSTYYLYTNQYWWSASPSQFHGTYVKNFGVNLDGSISDFNVISTTIGVRPLVSLKPGAKFASGGDGTSTNPYVVE